MTTRVQWLAHVTTIRAIGGRYTRAGYWLAM